jgi:hypothetical protein
LYRFNIIQMALYSSKCPSCVRLYSVPFRYSYNPVGYTLTTMPRNPNGIAQRSEF